LRGQISNRIEQQLSAALAACLRCYVHAYDEGVAITCPHAGSSADENLIISFIVTFAQPLHVLPKVVTDDTDFALIRVVPDHFVSDLLRLLLVGVGCDRGSR
jgi:hypothetical protein